MYGGDLFSCIDIERERYTADIDIDTDADIDLDIDIDAYQFNNKLDVMLFHTSSMMC